MPLNYIRLSQLMEDIPYFSATCLQWVLAKVKAKQVGRFPLQRLKLEDGFQVGGRGELGEANRRM